MSSFLCFTEEEVVRIWNSSFSIIHRFLQRKASVDETAKLILEINYSADAIKRLDLKDLTRAELQSFVELMSLLKAEIPGEAKRWREPDHLIHFLADLELVIEAAKRVVNGTGAQ